MRQLLSVVGTTTSLKHHPAARAIDMEIVDSAKRSMCDLTLHQMRANRIVSLGRAARIQRTRLAYHETILVVTSQSSPRRPQSARTFEQTRQNNLRCNRRSLSIAGFLLSLGKSFLGPALSVPTLHDAYRRRACQSSKSASTDLTDPSKSHHPHRHASTQSTIPRQQHAWQTISRPLRRDRIKRGWPIWQRQHAEGLFKATSLE